MDYPRPCPVDTRLTFMNAQASPLDACSPSNIPICCFIPFQLQAHVSRGEGCSEEAVEAFEQRGRDDEVGIYNTGKVVCVCSGE